MSLNGVEIGARYTFSKTVTESDVYTFAGLTGDLSETHVNEDYMRRRSTIGTRIAHGALLVGFMSTASTLSIAHLIHREDLEEFPVSLGYDRLRFIRPVRFGDTVYVHYTVTAIDEHKRRSSAQVEVVNQDGEVVAAAVHIMQWTRALSTRGEERPS
jgi:acyl dehydratase